VEALNSGRFADSVRESVHAVESVARVLSKDASATLAPALQELEKGNSMHPAFKRALSQLYGYSSNEGGIRHSLLEDEAHVNMHDALFMLGGVRLVCDVLDRQGSRRWNDFGVVWMI
jgi:hypothetical protein